MRQSGEHEKVIALALHIDIRARHTFALRAYDIAVTTIAALKKVPARGRDELRMVILFGLTPASFPLANHLQWEEGPVRYHNAIVTRRQEKTQIPQASSTLYLLRVVTVVTSVTIVPKSSRSDSASWVLVKDCPVAFPSYEGRKPEPRVSDNACEGKNAPSTFTGINFQICSFGVHAIT